MFEDVYARITEENVRKYGTDIARYGPTLLANLYNDRTHFIYELLQNAEDACERARKGGVSDGFVIHFSLFQDRLEVRHNGIPFDESDVRGICGIVEGTKKDDLSQIGKFGIGFKSVYAFTKSPEIYSGDWCFQIKDYVHPYPLNERNDVGIKETLFIIPFNHDEVSKEISFDGIKKRLQNLDVRNLLFLNNVSEIEWNIMGQKGCYSRSVTRVDEHARRVTLLWDGIGEVSEKDKPTEDWMVFHRPVTISGKDARVEVAFKVSENKIVPFNDAKLAAFFLTDKDTYLKFIIQGPYRTTPARDNIHIDDDINKTLLEETAKLVSETISRIKGMGMLDVSFLSTLPIETEKVTVENIIFTCIYNSVKEKLLGQEALLPTYGGGHVDSRNALIVRGKELLELLSSEQLRFMFKKTGARWLDENITIDKTRPLRDYLMSELDIVEIDPNKFAREFTEPFIREQSDDWIKKFYRFLSGREELWGESYSYSASGVLRSKSIIRLEDNKHVQPFNSNGEANVYLPGRNETRFLTVKKCLVADEQAKKFLYELGLREPDVIDDIINNILSKYGMVMFFEVTIEENKQDVKYIFDTLAACTSQERKDKLLSALKESYFLLAKHFGSNEAGHKKPCEIYLGEVYAHSNVLSQYFEGNHDIWFLDELYAGMFDVVFFEQIGCKDEIEVKYNSPARHFSGHVTLNNSHGFHKRGLDGFDPECSIDGLEYALKNINIQRAGIIWDIVKRFHKSIYGIIESSSRQGFVGSRKESEFSIMGELVVKNSWIPDKNGVFHKPGETVLADLPDGFDKESLEAKYVAKYLGFKPDAEQELLAQLPEGKKKMMELFLNLSPNEMDKVTELIQKIREQSIEKDSSFSVQDIGGKFKESLGNKQPVDARNDEGGAWKGMDPEEEEDVRKKYGDELLDKLKDAELKSDIKTTKKSEISEGLNPKEFLFEQYKGFCQICNTLLDLGAGKQPYFEVYRIFETRNKHAWSNMEFNVLCLCPNCHALTKHGGAYLEEIRETAEKVIKREIAPEEVDERGGDFYIMNIVVVGEKRQIFYTPTHMAKLAAFIEKSGVEE